MSRTYRKNPRWFTKYKGVYYNDYKDKTIIGEVRKIKCSSYPKGPFLKEDYPIIFNGSLHYFEALVGDTDCFPRYNGRNMKKCCQHVDRARYSQALYNHNDANIKSSFDPWDYD
jgi:hypothetical protein